ncbi:hypothetical protein TEA_020078 [Camellia sinensis var. sinensis]|uniref:ABC transporter domain-containing protein n=1 Tax=Camellia sinensis var. sinensis TaxID=542762 RepID=A0A4S4EJJ1_CAMSN|nr:hypothetical protein TEA_020078 [Camellia sinensis var. sinensis]
MMKGTPFEKLVSAYRNVITVLDLKINKNYSESQKGDRDHLEETKRPYLSKGNKERNVYVKGLPEVQLTDEEEKENDNVGWKPFFDYILVSKGSLFLCLTSKVFFSGFINSVFDAPMLFFDSTPIGWILTRASSDLSVLDFNIPSSVFAPVASKYVPRLVGLFSNALALTVTQVFMTRWYSSFCNYIISVERIKQFMHIPPEPPAIVEDKRPLYRSNARLVLNGITCIFTEGTKVGIVGRTGNGKTVLVSKLGYGCMGLSGAYNSPVSDEDGIAIIKYAYSKGELVEYDDPSKLRETNSSFSKLEAEYWSSCRRNSVLL